MGPAITAMPCGHYSRWRFFSAARAGRHGKKWWQYRETSLTIDIELAPPDSEGEPVLWNRRNGHAHQASTSTTLKPMARAEELIVQEVEDEVLVYDQWNSVAHCLSADAARIWRACDGEKSESEIAAALNLDVDVVVLALEELDNQVLLVAGTGPARDEDGATRREFGIKAAKLGGAVAVAPVIYSIVAPTALASATT